MRKSIISFGKMALISSLVSTSLYSFEVNSVSDAVNISGKQRMYAQRIMKDYGMIGLEVKFGNPKEDLQKTIKEFDEHLEALKKFNKDPKIRKSLAQESRVWQNIKTLLSKKPTKENAIKLHEELHKLVNSADDTTKLFASKAGKSSGNIINISGRQRMLSQKIAALYMLRVWGADDKEMDEHMEKAMKLFKDSLNTLKQSSLNTPEINNLLKKVENDFKFFEIMSRSKTKFIPSLIYNKSNDILQKMDRVTELYSKQKIK